MKYFYYLFLIFAYFIFSNHFDPFEEENPFIFHHVNVITGHFNLAIQDGIVKGPVNLTVDRYYSSSGALERTKDNYDLRRQDIFNKFYIQGGWSLFPHIYMLVGKENRDQFFYVAEKNGNNITYLKSQNTTNDGYNIYVPKNKDDLVCTTLGSKNCLSNNRIIPKEENKKQVVYLYHANGSVLYYQEFKWETRLPVFKLKEERLPNGFKIVYDYTKKHRIKSIKVIGKNGTEYNKIDIEINKTSPPFSFKITSTDQQTIKYDSIEHEKRSYISNVTNTNRLPENYRYEPSRRGAGARLNLLTISNNHQFELEYYNLNNNDEERAVDLGKKEKPFNIDKVKYVKAKVGQNSSLKNIAYFVYQKNQTRIRDVEGLLRVYCHDGKKLNEIHYYDENDKLYSIIKFVWSGNSISQKIFCDKNGFPIFAKVFNFDLQKNVIKEVIYGNISGRANIQKNKISYFGDHAEKQGYEKYCRDYTYYSNNLIKSETEDNGLSYQYRYKPGTDLISSKFTLDQEGNIFIREYNIYDSNNLLVKSIVDDGNTYDEKDISSVNQRTIKYIINNKGGLPAKIAEYFLNKNESKECLLKRRVLYYKNNKVIKEEIYDADDVYRYSIHISYDKYDNVISRSTPTGLKNTYLYKNNNLVEIDEVGQCKKIYQYDRVSRPISCQEVGSKGEILSVEKNQYDVKGRLILKTEGEGNQTEQKFDCFGRCIETLFPQIIDEHGNRYNPSIKYNYDVSGNLTSSETQNGNIIKNEYNIYRKTIKKIRPDGAEIIYTYYKDGNLAKTIYPDKTEDRYEYDVLGRTLSKSFFSPENELITEEKWEYNSFNLKSYTNQFGITTYYYYDGAGRKIAENILDRWIYYTYDALGFLKEKSDGNISQITICDEEGKVLEKWDEDLDGNQESYIQFTYDDKGFKKEAIRDTSQGIAKDMLSFDDKGRLISHVDALGNATKFIFNDRYRNDIGQDVLQKTTIDALGNEKIETFDILSHLVSLEKRDQQGNTVLFEEYFYDFSGNKVLSKSTVFENGEIKDYITIRWEYDLLGNLVKQIEQGEKTTTFSYDISGLCLSKTLPSKVTIFYDYDYLGRILNQKSSDGSIDYSYEYTNSDDPSYVIDNITSHEIEREYDFFGNLLNENHSNGIFYKWQYDVYGRCKEFFLPDGSSIKYKYLGNHLKQVIRKKGNIEYAHTYLAFDKNGHVSKEKLIFNLGYSLTEHDLLERPVYQSSYHFFQNVSYGPTGLITHANNSIFSSKDYGYDSLSQLNLENNKRYSFNSFGNSLDHQISQFNEVLSTPEQEFKYDSNGCPSQRILSDGEEIEYKYDALNRLISIEKPYWSKIEFKYDCFSRLISMKRYVNILGYWISRKKVFFIHDKDFEIGSLDEDLNIIDLKILGLGIKGDIGAAVAIELKDKFYIPINDFRGNIIGLVSSLGKIVEEYDFDAFGRDEGKKTNNYINPWRFSSKRHIDGLVLFKERFYDPHIGRWLTPDPSGFVEGLNLYLFVLNNPINRLDLFGLFSDGLFDHDGFPVFQMPITNLPVTPLNIDMGKLIPLKIIQGKITVDGFVHSNQLHKLKYSAEEMREGKINLLNHFSEIMPKDGSVIGLVTIQNGINTVLEELKGMGQSIIKSIPSSTTVIGVHCPTEGFVKDASKAGFELVFKDDTAIVSFTRQVLVAIAETIDKINPKLLWAHIAHSRGGGIAFRAIQGMNDDQKSLMKKHNLYFGVGGSKPMPKKFAFDTNNIYSKSDYITGWSGKLLQYNKKYNIQILPCISRWKDRSMYFADHAFMAPTYQDALKDQIDRYQLNYGFYDEKVR